MQNAWYVVSELTAIWGCDVQTKLIHNRVDTISKNLTVYAISA